MKILIFGGTTEGRQIAECLAKNKIHCEVCVATKYGSEMLSNSEFLRIRQGRLTSDEMTALLSSDNFSALIDATHPYAVEVSKNIREAVKKYDDAIPSGDVKKSLPLLRFSRQGANKAYSNIPASFPDAGACAQALKSTSGKILLTTGSKNLSVFCADPELRSRLIVRTLPSQESLELCTKNGLEGHQILAMQGPFSKEMNVALIREYGISVLVTKESGAAGGFSEKLEAAKECGIQCFVIEKPKALDNSFQTFSALYAHLEEILQTKINYLPKINITLIGAGMGSPDGMTVEAQKALQNADYIFGAERLLSIAQIGKKKSDAKKFAFYLAKDILPVLQEARKTSASNLNAVVLFSGDTGFYSGADAFYNEAEKLPDTEVKIIPGISCVQYLCAKFHKNWQNYEFLSLHGVKKSDWINKLSDIVNKSRQIFFITSSFMDIQALSEEILKLLHSKSADEDSVKVLIGFNLSYPDEKLFTISLKECAKISTPGLYCGIIEL
ncbi:MAG: precorrin-6A reductase [Treponema sp.]|nr:precorrin-6A reductase [Treponema sp.]